MSSLSGHVLLDGYNLAHAWASTRLLMKRGRLDEAAEQVVSRARPLHDALGHDLTVVFDGSRAAMSIEHPDGDAAFTVVYAAAGETADAVIERLLARTPSTEGWRVASNDLAIAQTAASYGAESLSADALAQWIVQAEANTARWMQRRRAENADRWGQGGTRP